MMCHEDEETAIERGLDGGHFFGYSLAHFYVFGQHKPGVTNVWDEFQERRSLFGFDRNIAAQTGQQLGAQLMEEGLGALRGAIGTPDQLRGLIRGYQDAGVDQLIFVACADQARGHLRGAELFERGGHARVRRTAEAARRRRWTVAQR